MELVAETMAAVDSPVKAQAGERSQRDAQGRFAKGNTCARKSSGGSLAAVTRLMREAATEDKIREACEKIVEKAASGCIGAAKLMFQFLERAAEFEPIEEDAVHAVEPSSHGAPSSTVKTDAVSRSVAENTVEAVPLPSSVTTVEPSRTVKTVEPVRLPTAKSVPVMVGKEIAAAKKARYRQLRKKWADKKASRKRKKSKR